MKILAAWVVAAQLVSAAVDIRSVKHASTAIHEPNSYIVEIEFPGHLKRGFVSPHEELYHYLQRRGTNWTVTAEYHDLILTGVAVQVASDADLVTLAEAQGVRSITPVRFYNAPEPVRQHMTRNRDGVAPNGASSTHVMTGVDRLHSEGYFGAGIKIGIIDSGIDYNHPSLGGGFGPGKKVIGGYDFVGDDYAGRLGPPPSPDNDPLDDCNGHGTHVAGIIAADPNNPWDVSGVAHKSEINAYRVFGCRGGTSDVVIVSSLLRAFNDGNHIINLSLGGPGGWSGDFSAVIASRIADMGRIVIVSAGNDGEYGSWYASSPSSGLSVISVGSVENTILNIQNAIVSNERRIPYMSLENLEIPAGLPIYATSQDPAVVDDACNSLSPDTPDLSNRLVLIRRGTCPFVNKTNNAAVYGARYFLIYNNVDGPLVAISTNYTSALISQQDGLFLLQEGISNNYTVSFPDSPSIIENPAGGLMSPFSTYGPTYDMYLKPAISAPGGSILSTIPVALGSWSVESGTSMAAPYVAGSAALLLEIKGNEAEVAKAARSIFQNNAIPVESGIGNSTLIETASSQGAGLINVYDAIKNTGSLLPAELLLNDTAHFNGTYILTVRNGGNESVMYTFAHAPAGTANTIQGIEAIPGPVPLTGSSANVEFAPTELNVPAGESLQVQVTITPPTELDAARLPVFSGYIRATGSDNTTLQCTYMGLAASLKDAKIIDNTDGYFGVQLPLIIDKDGNPVAPDQTVTYTMNGIDAPLVIYRLAMGTSLLRVHLVDSTTNVTRASRRSTESNNKPTGRSDRFTTPGSNYTKRSIMDWVSSRVCQSCGGVPTLGVLLEADYFPRNTIALTPGQGGYSAANIRQFANGTTIPDGDYRIMVQALKVFGDPNAPGDYEVWTSPVVQIRRSSA